MARLETRTCVCACVYGFVSCYVGTPCGNVLCSVLSFDYVCFCACRVVLIAQKHALVFLGHAKNTVGYIAVGIGLRIIIIHIRKGNVFQHMNTSLEQGAKPV